MKTMILLVMAAALLSNATAQTDFRMPAFFSDHMVLQQNADAQFWGTAAPGAEIVIVAEWGGEAAATAADDGKWKAALSTPAADGPFTITITAGGERTILNDVMVGEVWLCSGQSNMEMPVKGWPPNDLIKNSKEEIATADYPAIRMFTVPRTLAYEPQNNVGSSWEVCTPSTVGDFSATAYFFGRKLHKELGVPVGLLHSSWGGTPAEAWTNAKYLEDVPGYEGIAKTLSDSIEVLEEYETWLQSFPTVKMSERIQLDYPFAGISFDDEAAMQPDFDDTGWASMELPKAWEETELGQFDGVVWFRKEIEIPAGWQGEDLIISLGPIDDMDRTFVNGEVVGSIERGGEWQTLREYKIPSGIVGEDNLLLAVRVLDNRGGGGIVGTPGQMFIKPEGAEEQVSIAGEWKYLPVAEFRNEVFYVYGTDPTAIANRPAMEVQISSHTPTFLYNGMIAPLVPFTVQGAIWYQGESNAGRPQQYETLFPAMITNWRDDWGYDFPFYFVQIAPYDYGAETNSEALRDAQRKTLSLPNTGMAVTLDIGNNENIHPGNKQDVGKRLALWALAHQYGKDIVYSGPLYERMTVEDGKAVIEFAHTEGGLVLKPVDGNNELQVAGKDGTFYKAQAEVKDDKLIVWSEEVEEPAAVRYAWSNTAGAALFNGAGLPASSFRADDLELNK